MTLTFFTRKSHVARGQLFGGSSLIRGEQIAEYLHAKLNPENGYENDVCVYVKPGIDRKTGKPFATFAKKTYIDIIDNKRYIQWLREYPELSGIVTSEYCYDFLKDEMKDRITFIPQQHCNFERFVRSKKEITTVGIIGTPSAFQYSILDTRERLERIGLQLLTKSDYTTREDVANFYKNTDIQIVWYYVLDLLKNPLKIINAASFGIPTVGFPHRSYKEVEGYYTPVRSINQLFAEVEKLKNPENYARATKNLLPMAEKYHISKIAEKYAQLDMSA
jgi:hypothetical protein